MQQDDLKSTKLGGTNKQQGDIISIFDTTWIPQKLKKIMGR
jgi:hypothetical protein